MKIDFPTVILLIVLGFFVTGALLAYPLNPNEFNADVTADGTQTTVTIHSTIESEYTAVAVDLRYDTSREILFYYDEGYDSPISCEDQMELFEDLNKQLRYLNVEVTQIDADELKTYLQDTANAKKYSILITAGAFPDNVYTFCEHPAYVNDLVSPWMSAGGMVLWYSPTYFGYYSAHPIGSDNGYNNPFSNNPFGLLFGSERAYCSERSSISKIVGTTQNICEKYAVQSAPGIINLGYESEDGRYSIAYWKHANGGAIINGGDWTDDMSFAKIIASQVYDWTTLTPEYDSGTFKGAKTVTFPTSACDAIYVYLGTLAPRYGELFLLP